MGIGPFKSCGGAVTNTVYVSMNPNPKKFRIDKLIEIENTYVEVFYPDAKNYEGSKVMVYTGRVAEKILAAKELDPHFSASGLSPVARFAPTIEGKWLAMQITKGLNNG